MQVLTISDELSARFRDVKASRKKRRLIPAAPANSSIDLKEESSEHFAKGLNFYKLFLICFVGSFAGVVIEVLWCIAKNGYIESRSGLVYGPFNLLYGAGAVALTLALHRFRNRGSWLSFAGAFVVGSILEYACSWAQEFFIGSCSWDYTGKFLNINGRICLVYSIFWGVLGIIWIKNLYPRMANLILKIPQRIGKIVTWVLVVFMVVNSAVTVVAVTRWSQRVDGVPADSAFLEFIDQRFPDSRMERIFANMTFGDEEAIEQNEEGWQ
ncbi:MAG: putative ABC transporter permease [Clostridia bacterium]|nr:putative ABC transporter permease [Clostridia bacterium]